MKADVSTIPGMNLPPAEAIAAQWKALTDEAAEQKQSVFKLSSAMALSAIADVPQNLLWLSKASAKAAQATGEFFAEPLLVHYAETLAQIRKEGFLAFWSRQFSPYLQAAAKQFSPKKQSLTERWLSKP